MLESIRHRTSESLKQQQLAKILEKGVRNGQQNTR
jgi:hypothetical protein